MAGRIPLGMLTIITGNPDTGKTCFLCDLVARTTTGKGFPDGKASGEPNGGEVLMLISEDDVGRVIKPRLIAAGADISCVDYITGVKLAKEATKAEREFALDSDMAALETELIENPLIALITIDPVSSYLGKKNLNDTQEVRNVLRPLGDLCEKYNVTAVGVGHFNKTMGVGAIHKTGGSVALTAIARAVFMLARDPEDEKQFKMLVVKANLSKKRTGLKYHIGERDVNDVGTVPAIEWGEETAEQADELLARAAGQSEDNRAARAKKFLSKYLTEPKLTKDVEDAAKAENVSSSALWEVKKDFCTSKGLTVIGGGIRSKGPKINRGWHPLGWLGWLPYPPRLPRLPSHSIIYIKG